LVGNRGGSFPETIRLFNVFRIRKRAIGNPAGVFVNSIKATLATGKFEFLVAKKRKIPIIKKKIPITLIELELVPEKGGHRLRCSSVKDPQGIFSFFTPRLWPGGAPAKTGSYFCTDP